MSEIDDLFKKHLKPKGDEPAAPGTAAPKPPDVSGLDTVLNPIRTYARHAVNKGTFGLADQAAAFLRGKDVADIRKEGADMRKRDPWSATAGDVSGLVAQQIPVMKGLKAGTAAAPALAWAHRASDRRQCPGWYRRPGDGWWRDRARRCSYPGHVGRARR